MESLKQELKEHEAMDKREHARLAQEIEHAEEERDPKYRSEHDAAEKHRHKGSKHSHDPYYHNDKKNK